MTYALARAAAAGLHSQCSPEVSPEEELASKLSASCQFDMWDMDLGAILKCTFFIMREVNMFHIFGAITLLFSLDCF